MIWCYEVISKRPSGPCLTDDGKLCSFEKLSKLPRETNYVGVEWINFSSDWLRQELISQRIPGCEIELENSGPWITDLINLHSFTPFDTARAPGLRCTIFRNTGDILPTTMTEMMLGVQCSRQQVGCRCGFISLDSLVTHRAAEEQ